MDRRQQKTRDAIFSAFSELLSQNSFNKITVQQIIDAANVGRTTFYAHFETKDDLLREMCIEIFDHVFSSALQAKNTHDFSLSAEKPSALITHILYHLRDNRKNILGILSCESVELFLGYFRQYLDKSLALKLADSCALSGVPQDFLINHISGSFVNMVRWWTENGLAKTPEELAEYFLAVIPPIA
ncbi:MAG: TetR/AcrR family transcriptional regulator [Eubacteriales bacterium]|nr:TetR/AcrR family transcriptional regulator [Eubacteriales bacterium]MDD3882560.1 TetR/AcrR family transcriptional regulator [Eubacteriales bacterium]MDD4512859.1 TetR/AcrR family transcriptional regulator [Eubacteriales bacterium]